MCFCALFKYDYVIENLDFWILTVVDHGLTLNDVCPFCGGSIESHDESYDAAIHAETKRIVPELAVIAATENSVREEQEGISKNIAGLSSRRAEISEAIAKEH